MRNVSHHFLIQFVQDTVVKDVLEVRSLRSSKQIRFDNFVDSSPFHSYILIEIHIPFCHSVLLLFKEHLQRNSWP